MKNQYQCIFILSLLVPLSFTHPAISQPTAAIQSPNNQEIVGRAGDDKFSVSNRDKTAISKLIADSDVGADPIKEDCFDPQYELLAKEVYLYFFEQIEQNRPFLNRLLDAQGYAIARVFDAPSTNFQAIGLSSKDGSKPPVLWFPGGDPGDTSSPGLSKFSPNKQVIKDWLVTITNDQKLNPQGFKPDVTGQSLGGALTQLTASEFPTLIGSAISFQSPGIAQKTAEKFIENGGNPHQVRHYIVDGDFRSLIGEAFIPGKVVVSFFEIPASEQGNYFQRKHASGILADFQPFQSLIPENVDPFITQAISAYEKPANQTLSEISVDELNEPDFTFQGKDWQIGLEKVRAKNSNFVVNRQHVEALRRSDFEALFKSFSD